MSLHVDNTKYKTKESDVEVIAIFNSNGDIIPSKIRYFDVIDVEYKSYKIKRINYTLLDKNERIYSLRLENGEDRKLALKNTIWKFK